MKSGSKFGGVFTAKIEMSTQAQARAKFGGVFTARCERDGKIIWEEKVHNIVTDEGCTEMLDVMFSDATQITDWYLALVESNTAAAAAMTYAVPTYTECAAAAYDEGARQIFVEPGVAAKAITNSAADADFTMAQTKTLYGACFVGGGTEATTAADVGGGGTLFAYGLFGSPRSVVDGDIVHLTYTLSAADDA